MKSLFSVFIPVAKAASRPPFWTEETGSCLFFLFADDKDDAHSRADGILGNLPYVATSAVAYIQNRDIPSLSVFEPDLEQPPSAFDDVLDGMEAKARAAGLSFAFCATFDPAPRIGDTFVMRPRNHADLS
jgi:hypothetical protein